ncbi:Cytochrome P450 4c3 [Halotydeus destructor]|nr:Cytochrome P450 4c3 [Halotydeus destructor]
MAGPPAFFLYGNLGSFFESLRKRKKGMPPAEAVYNEVLDMSRKYSKDGLFRFWVGNQPKIGLTTPETVKIILSSDDHINKSLDYDYFIPWLGQGLLISKNDTWRRQRKFLTPTFGVHILDTMIDSINRHCKTMCQILAEKSDLETDHRVPSMFNDLKMCTLDIIGEVAMGVKIDAQKNPKSKYTTTLKAIFMLFIARVVKPWLHYDWIYRRTESGRLHDECVDYLHQFHDQLVQERKKEFVKEFKNFRNQDLNGLAEKNKLSFLDTLLFEHLTNPDNLSEVDIRSHVNVFIVAGHDITSITIMWALYMLGLNEACQENVHQELDAIFVDDPDRPMNLDDARDMRYLEMCLKEAARLYPAGAIIARDITVPTQVNGHDLPLGGTAVIFASLVHKDPNHWPEPEKFDPERFTPEMCSGRDPYAFLAFSAGPRNCIAQKVGLIEAKLILAHILRKFRVTSVNGRDKIHVNPAVLLIPTSSVQVRLMKR